MLRREIKPNDFPKPILAKILGEYKKMNIREKEGSSREIKRYGEVVVVQYF